jgi:hypothetical protein
MQSYTISFIAVNALHVSGGFSAHHQELKTVHTVSVKLAATASLGEFQLTHTGIRSLDFPARSESLYRLRHPVPENRMVES